MRTSSASATLRTRSTSSRRTPRTCTCARRSPGRLQTKIAAGTINLAAQFGTLRDAGIRRVPISLEVVHQDYMGTIEDDVLTETVALRDLFRSWQDG